MEKNSPRNAERDSLLALKEIPSSVVWLEMENAVWVLGWRQVTETAMANGLCTPANQSHWPREAHVFTARAPIRLHIVRRRMKDDDSELRRIHSTFFLPSEEPRPVPGKSYPAVLMLSEYCASVSLFYIRFQLCGTSFNTLSSDGGQWLSLKNVQLGGNGFELKTIF